MRRMGCRPRLCHLLSTATPIRDGLGYLARDLVTVARRHPAGVDALTAAIAVAITVLSVATAARTVIDTLGAP